MSKSILWSEEETAVLREMKAAGATVPEIMARLGRSKYGIKERWRWLNTDEEERAKRCRQINLNRNIRAQFGNGISATRSAATRLVASRLWTVSCGVSLSRSILITARRNCSGSHRWRGSHER
jgi:hypothetical protein